MGRLVQVEENLLRDAYDVVSSLKEENEKLASDNQRIPELEDEVSRYKIAEVLEEKSSVPYEKIVEFKEGRLSKEENDKFRKMAENSTEYASSLEKVETTKIAEDFHSEGFNSRKLQRAQMLLDDLSELRNI